MSDVKITHGHRLAAAESVVGDHISDYTLRWVDVGGDVSESAYGASLARVAQAFANTEHRTRVGVIADVLAELHGLLERSEFIGRVDYVQADSIRNLIVHLGGEDV